MKKIFLLTYFWILLAIYAIASIYDILIVCRGLMRLLMSVIIVFIDITLAVHLLSTGILDIILGLCFFGLIYVLFVGSTMSPFYTRKLIVNNSKLPIGRRKY